MGLFSFVKNAGAKIFGGKKADKKAEETPNPREEAMAQERAIMEYVEKLELNVENFSVLVDGERAVISGDVDSQATREKVILAVGNVEGIGEVDDKMSLETPEPEAKFHTVESGDSLSKIAKEHYGDAMKYPHIFEANKPMLKSPDLIYPGQVLRIPPLD